LQLTPAIQLLISPGLLSNIVDVNTGRTPEPMHEYLIIEKCGLKIGLLGLVEGDWIATIPSFPENFKHQPMAERARELSAKLRGEKGCDLVIALTHSRLGNDIKLANDVGAVKWTEGSTNRGEGVDLLLGGHDHGYYVGRGADNWVNWDRPDDLPGTEADQDCL
jgi:5'-nucleotidase